MTARMLLVGLLALPLALGAQDVVFRSQTDVVAVDVSVRDGSKVVTGLTAADFELRDAGEVQTLGEVVYESVPIETTLVVDMSGSVEGPLLGALLGAVDGVKSRLRQTDRINLVRFNQRIAETPIAPGMDLSKLLAGPVGQTSLMDALVTSLIRPRDPASRQLVMLFTDGGDTLSFLDEATVLSVAARAEAAVFVVAVTDGTVVNLPHKALFDTLTEATGGHLAVLGRRGNLGDAFVRALDDFRQSYVLRYTVRGEPRPGWHQVDVRLVRSGRYDVRARRGYFVTPDRRLQSP